MRKIYLALLLALATPLLILKVSADPNTAPFSVGLYNFSTFTVGTATAIPIIPANLNRASFIVQNNGAVSVVIKPNSVPGNTTDGIVLVAGAIWMPNPPPVNAFYGQSASSTAKIVMIEGIK